MRIALLSETFSKKMGYIQNTLPKYLARLGCEVHVLTMDLPPYYQIEDFGKVYGNFNPSSDLHPGTIESIDGYQLHVLKHSRQIGYMRMHGLRNKLRDLHPDIVQTSVAVGWL